ncbi:hypothetical protein ACQ4LE_009802 [Meloidogyne hapla]
MEFTKFSLILQFIEVLPITILIPCSLLNLFLLSKSSVLHNNSKIILISQSIVIFIYSSNRFFMIILIVLGLKDLSLATNYTNSSIGLACINFGNLIGHVLIMERTIATLFTTKYGQTKIPIFGICCILILLFLVTLALFCNNGNLNFVSIFAIHLSLLFSILELIVLSRLTAFNKKIYKQFLNNKSNNAQSYKLNERYQQLENVYTGKQLAPSFFFHFINILCSNILTIVSNYVEIPVELIINIVYLFLLIHAFCKLFIEVTVITSHPVLNRNLNKIIASIFIYFKCFRTTKVFADKENDKNCLKSISTKEQQIHFEMLGKLWE